MSPETSSGRQTPGRQGLVAPATDPSRRTLTHEHRNGLPLLPWKAQGAPVDLELVNSLRDELA